MYFGLSDYAINNIEIVVGPEMSEGDIELLFSLADRYQIDRKRIKPSVFSDVNSFVLSSEMDLFRNAIEKTKSLFNTEDCMSNFPSGCSEDASDLLAYHFYNKYGKTSIQVIGRSNDNMHTWIECDGLIYDITAELYDEYSKPYSGKYDVFHNRFSFTNNPTNGIRHRSSKEQERLVNVYKLINRNIENR